jgi:hypothetical protein
MGRLLPDISTQNVLKGIVWTVKTALMKCLLTNMSYKCGEQFRLT